MYSRSFWYLSFHGWWTAIAHVEKLFSSVKKELFKADTYEMKLHMNNDNFRVERCNSWNIKRSANQKPANISLEMRKLCLNSAVLSKGSSIHFHHLLKESGKLFQRRSSRTLWDLSCQWIYQMSHRSQDWKIKLALWQSLSESRIEV